jgi:hypothetical protein
VTISYLIAIGPCHHPPRNSCKLTGRTQSIAITANTPFSEWGEVFVDAAMTVAAVDRLVHHSTILEMNVESYRRRTAQAKQAPAKRTRAAATTTTTTAAN